MCPPFVLNTKRAPPAVNKNHHTTVMRTRIPPIEKDDENTALAESQPCISDALGVAACSEISFVTAKLMPVIIRNVLNVIKKLGILVFITRYPLRKPTPSARISASPPPNQRLR